jgi:hypothetical protein
MGLPVTIYHRPNGRQEDIICNNINEDDLNKEYLWLLMVLLP